MQLFLKLTFMSLIILFCANLHSSDFDEIYKQEGGKIKSVLINTHPVKYYHYIDNSKITNSTEKSKFFIKLNRSTKLNHIPELFKLKHINGASFRIEEYKLVDFLSKYFDGKEIEFIENYIKIQQ